MESGSDRTEAEEEKAPMDNSGAGGARPDKMDWDREDAGGSGAKQSTMNSPVGSCFSFF